MSRRMSAVLILALALAVLAGSVPAADAPKDDGAKSGTKPGQWLPGPFQPFNATGARKDKYHCLVCEHGLNPVVMIFAREPGELDGPLAKLITQSDAAVAKDQNRALRGFVVFLTDDERIPQAKKLAEWSDAAKLKEVVLSSFDGEGPKGYDIDKETEVMVLLYYKLHVVKNYTFGKDGLTEAKVKEIMAAVERLGPQRK